MYFEQSLEGIFDLRMCDDSTKILTKSSTCLLSALKMDLLLL